MDGNVDKMKDSQKDDMSGGKKENYETDGAGTPSEDGVEEYQEGEGGNMSEIAAKLDKVINMLAGLAGGGTMYTLPESGSPAQDASSVAYQKPQDPNTVLMYQMQETMKKQQETMQSLQDEVVKLQSNGAMQGDERVLAALCEENPHIDYQSNLECLRKFSTSSDREVLLNLLKTQIATFGKHQMTEIAQNYQFDKSDEVMKDYVNASPKVQMVARKAYQNYQDTIHQDDEKAAKRFASIHPDVKKFVEHSVEEEKENPGYVDGMTKE